MLATAADTTEAHRLILHRNVWQR